ncbi:MAG: hypothetical protein KDA91_11370 [Planctomycetaceae bacterium]|nr:hypothetical protein [Planctomycetaceae bacterium]
MIAAVDSQAHTQTNVSQGSLIVFSDDWGRHPSSCQHLVKHLLDDYSVLWVNTIGTRAPRLDWATMARVAEKLKQWSGISRSGSSKSAEAEHDPEFGHTRKTHAHSHPNLSVVNPKMWPWFGRDFDRKLNQWLLCRQLSPLIEKLPKPVYAITTLPLTADLPAVLPVHRWLYYCVDDFSQWPGLDGNTLRRMDSAMIRAADSLVAVSENLQRMIADEGRTSTLLTHGVDQDFWRSPDRRPSMSHLLPEGSIVFWGVVDRRMDVATVRMLSQDLAAEDSSQGRQAATRIVLIGPQQDPDPALLALPNVLSLPAQPLEHLPAIAQEADVLIMPYADLPVTRAMQPLKLKEYLATGKPVVVNKLPATDEWENSMDVASSPEEFSRLVRLRKMTGVTTQQLSDRQRLADENWQAKARHLEAAMRDFCPFNTTSPCPRTSGRYGSGKTSGASIRAAESV